MLDVREKKRQAWARKMFSLKGASGLALRGWRGERNISQQELATEWGMSRRTIIRLERRDLLPMIVRVAMEVV